MTTVDLHELRELASSLALAASALVMDALDRPRASVVAKSSVVDVVTEMDHASEALIVAGILRARPRDGFIGEEGSDEAGVSGIRWLIDPIDGTTNYVYGGPGFAVSIAAQSAGRTVVGVVHDCTAGEHFVAVEGEGSSRNGQPVWCSAKDELATALLATGFSYDPARRRRQASSLVTVLPAVRDIRRRGSAALDLCAVACGRVDGYYELGLGAWDMAAGELIAREAGARTGNFAGGLAGSSIVAAAPGLFDRLIELLNRAGVPQN